MAFTDISNLVTSDDEQRRNLIGTLRGSTLWLIVSTSGLVLYAASAAVTGQCGPNPCTDSTSQVHRFLETLAVGMLVGGGSSAIGALMGFLFGVPKTARDKTAAASAPATESSTKANINGPRQEVNTNLEEVSDWLTKILVGVGLTQFDQLSTRVWGLAQHYESIGGPAVAVAIMLNFVIGGFLFSYLITRLFLAKALDKALDPTTIALNRQTEKAEDLQKEGEWGRALNAFEVALSQVTSNTPLAKKITPYEGAMFNALYQPPPGGFEKTIRYGQDFQRENPTAVTARMWVYLAAAYGQQFRYRRDNPGNGDPNESRQRALDSIKNALKQDPNLKDLLASMWNPLSPLKWPGDDDLEVFFDDEEFKKLLG